MFGRPFVAYAPKLREHHNTNGFLGLSQPLAANRPLPVISCLYPHVSLCDFFDDTLHSFVVEGCLLVASERPDARCEGASCLRVAVPVALVVCVVLVLVVLSTLTLLGF